MPFRHLPPIPNLENLRNQAKTLQRRVRAGEVPAVEAVREFHPSPDLAGFRRADAQLVVARRYGFASWRRLVAHVARLDSAPASDIADLADEFLRLGCLIYGGDDRFRHARARELLAAHPEITAANIFTMAATGDVAAARTVLAAEPAAATRPGGPYGWPPLLYLAYSRAESTRPGYSTVEVARLLLAHGADPDTGYMWDGAYAFTALTGAFGGGEDAVNQPRHPHSTELARVLLDAGADPNDSQALYNRQFDPDDDHLELLFAYGLGSGSGGPWRARLGERGAAPPQLVQGQLLWAAEHDLPYRVRLLLRHGVDVNAARRGGRTAYELAVLHGNGEIAELLAAAGALRPDFDPVELFAAACMGADRAAADRLLAADPALAERTAAAQPDLVIRAAELGRAGAVRLLVDYGFDVNTRMRITPLHAAAYNGDLSLARELVELGADPAVRDTEFHSTPLGWAEHNDKPDVAAYLSPLTPTTSP